MLPGPVHRPRGPPTTSSTRTPRSWSRARPRRRRTSSSTRPTASSRRARRCCRCRRARWWSRPSRRATTPRPRSTRARGAPPGYFVLKDRPEVEGDQITDPKQETDQGGQPNVTFGFTDEGREAFAEVTEADRAAWSGERRRRRPAPLRQAVALSSPSTSRRPRQRDRLAADHRLLREPGRDRRPHRRPDQRLIHHHRGAGSRQVPPDRRAAGRRSLSSARARSRRPSARRRSTRV